jgi:phosphate starvation-inducible protein PhoH
MSRTKKIKTNPEEDLIITSRKVPQRPKLKNPIKLRRYDWTEKQKEIVDLNLDFDLLILSGPAGSAKTALSVYLALEALNQKKVSDILYIRSAVENSDNGIGFLPGDKEEKFSPYGVPFYDKVQELVPKNDIDRLVSEERLHVEPINFIRGQNWNARFIILDEAQNTPYKDLKTFLTRKGKFSKVIICADPQQTDLKDGRGAGGFDRMVKNLIHSNSEKALNAPTDEELDEHGIFYFEFTEEDIVRSEFVKFVCKRL